jgi:hypothetical protein
VIICGPAQRQAEAEIGRRDHSLIRSVPILFSDFVRWGSANRDGFSPARDRKSRPTRTPDIQDVDRLTAGIVNRIMLDDLFDDHHGRSPMLENQF